MASAEWFLDGYAGLVNTDPASVTAVEQDCTNSPLGPVPPCPERRATRTEAFEGSAVVGGRGGYWFEGPRWLGVAGDLSYFKAETRTVHIRVFPFSPLVMFRLPLLANDAFPNGRLQPYFGLGPTVVYEEASADFRPDLTRKASGTSVQVGFDFRAGVAWQFHQHAALFGEYRFTDIPISGEQESSVGGSFKAVDTEVTSQHVLFGVSFRF